MNYRVTLVSSVGAWILVYFNVLGSLSTSCGVVGVVIDTERDTRYRIIQQQYYEDLKNEDGIVYGWLTGDSSVQTRNNLKNIWKNGTDFVLDTFHHTTYPLNTLIDDNLGVNNTTHINIEGDVNCLDESHDTGVRQSVISAGCRYIDSEDVVVCDNQSLTTLPVLPPYLKLFELNLTNVRILPKGAFGQTTIESIKLEANNLLECIHPSAFEGVTGLKYLTINHNAIKMMRLQDFKSLNETMVWYMEHNKISLVDYDDTHTTPRAPGYGYGYNSINNNTNSIDASDPNDLDTVLPSLLIFSLMGNPLVTIPAGYFKPLRNSPLTNLSLMCCSLTYISPDTFTYLPNLAELDLSENPKLMPNLEQAFENVNSTALTVLNLANNNLAQIPTEILQKLNNLESLDLHGNLFDVLKPDCFASLYKSLNSLNLENCRIRTISVDTFNYFVKLDSLILANNRLSTIPPSISSLSKLRVLDMSSNVPTDPTYQNEDTTKIAFKISLPVFLNLSKLEYLSMNNLRISKIDRTTFKGLVKLKILSLRDTNVVVIDDNAFEDLSVLRVLDLENGEISEINQLTFSGLTNVDTLFLNRNNIDFPEAVTEAVTASTSSSIQYFNGDPDGVFIGGSRMEPFNNMPKLKWLYLSNNKIRYIHASIFKSLSNLQVLNMSSNSIHSWERRVFINNTALEVLRLERNNIGPITNAMFQDFMGLKIVPGIEENLDISNNPLVCGRTNCELIKNVNNKTLHLTSWNDSSAHTCLDTTTNKYYSMRTFNLSSEICNGKAPIEEPTESPDIGPDPIIPDQPETVIKNVSTFATTFVIVFLCVFLISSAGVFAYKRRFHLKYFWFVVKFNVVNLPDLNIVGKRKGSVTPYEFDIFLSYNHTDRGFIEDLLVPNIEAFPNPHASQHDQEDEDEHFEQQDIESFKSQSKLKVCIHERDFKAGVPITDNIVDFVDRSRKVVVVVSKNYLESQWCLYEMNLAYHRLIESGRRSFLVILLEDIPVTLRTKSLNYLLLSRTYLEWPGSQATPADRNVFWKRLKSSLGTVQ